MERPSVTRVFRSVWFWRRQELCLAIPCTARESPSYLLVEAADGYRVVFALPELDPAFTDRVILLADRADGHPLDNKEGPFHIVVPGEKRMARWVRQVTSLKVVQAP